MNDFNLQFGDYVVDSWFERDCLWKQVDQVVERARALVRKSYVSVTASAVIGAAVFAPPSAWASQHTVVSQAGVSSSDESLSKHSTDFSTEKQRLRGNIRSLLDRLKAGTNDGYKESTLTLADQALKTLKDSDSSFSLATKANSI
jgi:hypothetical protein